MFATVLFLSFLSFFLSLFLLPFSLISQYLFLSNEPEFVGTHPAIVHLPPSNSKTLAQQVMLEVVPSIYC